MKKHFFTLLILCIVSSITYAAGNGRKCSSAIVLQRQLLENPKMQLKRSKIEAFTNDYVSQHLNGQNSRQQAVVSVTIPVIFHVVYKTAAQNVSDQMILDQLQVINEDYGGYNADTSGIPSAFQSVKAHNTHIQFCLAKRDPNGASTTGVTRTLTTVTSFVDDDKVKFASSGGHDVWDRTKYLNIWICNLGDDLLGYAQFPGGDASTDGVVILYSSLPGGDAPFDLGRSATHEIGHWLNMIHIWGDTNCGDDEVADTPTQSDASSGCPTFPHVSCSNGPNGDMFMNYMDYTDDACMFMFSAGQAVRMQALFASGGDRVSLVTSNGCSPPIPAKPIANFSGTPTAVCPGNSVKFTDLSQNIPTSWLWTFTGGTPATSVSQNPTVTYAAAGTYAVKLKVTNSLGADSLTKSGYIVVGTPTGTALPFTEGFQSSTFPPTGWSLASNSGFNWLRSTTAGGFGTSSASVYFRNFINDGNDKKDDIISPTLNLNGTTNPKVKFDVAYARYSNNSTDTLEVLLSDACSGLVTSIYKKGGSNLSTRSNLTTEFTPTSTQWRQDSVAVPAAYLNKYVKVIFRNNGAFGNNIYVDNINVYGTTAATGMPTASFVSDTVVCAGGSITFTNTSTSSVGSLDSVRWTINGGTPSTSTVIGDVLSVFSTAGNYTVTLKAYKSGNVSTATKTIHVNAIPNVTVNSPSICSGGTATLTATGANTYLWSTSSTADHISVSPTTTTTYTVKGTSTATTCSKTVTATVTVNNSAPTVTITPNPASVCNGDAVVLTAGGANTYVWDHAGTTTTNTLTFVPTGAVTVGVSGTLTGCSAAGTVSVNVTVKPKPTVGVNSSSICSGNPATLTATGADSYVWNTSSTADHISVSPSTTTIYTVIGTTNGCTGTVNSTVSVTATPATPTIVQSKDTLYSSVVVPGASYKWFKSGVLQTTTNVAYYKITSGGIYTVQIVNGSCSSIVSANFNAVLTAVKYNKLDVSFMIVPNPNNGDFDIKLSSMVNKKYSLVLYNLTGQVVLQQEMDVRIGANVKKVNLNGIEKGSYILSIIGDDGIATQNIIVQ